jgi:hypothetical protein
LNPRGLLAAGFKLPATLSSQFAEQFLGFSEVQQAAKTTEKFLESPKKSGINCRAYFVNTFLYGDHKKNREYAATDLAYTAQLAGTKRHLQFF